MGTVRRIPPAHTPIPPGALARVIRPGAGVRAELAALLAERHGSPDLLLMGSGTQALTLGIAALTGEGGEVALPGWGCFDLVSAAVLGASAPGSLTWHHASLPRETHGTVYHPAALQALRAVLGPVATGERQ